jgi:hypothetical protein
MVASLLLAPVVYPWYLLWILPFVGFISTMPLIVWTVSILPTYLVWHLRAMGKPWKLPNWVLVLEYGAVAATAFAAAWRSNSRSRNNAQPTSEVPVP